MNGKRFVNDSGSAIGGGLFVVPAEGGCALPASANPAKVIGVSDPEGGTVQAGARVHVIIAGLVRALLAPGQSVDVDDVLGVAAGGLAKKWTSGRKVGRPLDATDNSASEAPVPIWIQLWTGG